MDLGTVVDRRPDLRWRGAGPIQIARLPSRRGGAICDSGATVAFMTTTANGDDQTSHPLAQFLRPSSCKGDTPKFSIRIPSVPLCLLAQQQSEASEQTDPQQWLIVMTVFNVYTSLH